MIVLALAAQYNWLLYQLDVKSYFLNGYVDDTIYVEKLEGFEVVGREDCVYKLKNALYGIK